MQRYRSRFHIFVISTLLTFPPLAICGEAALLKAVLIIVNGKRITQGELNEMAEFLLKLENPETDMSKVRMTREEIDELSGRALRGLVRMRLIFADAAKEGVSVTDETVRNRVSRLHIDLDKMPPIARKYVESECLIDHLFAKRGIPPYRPTPSEMRNLYRENKESLFTNNSFVVVRHLFLPIGMGNNPEAVQKQAEFLRQKIMEKPESERTGFFAEVAREFSQDRFAEQGGLLRISSDPKGWFPQEFGNKREDGEEIFPPALYKGITTLRKEDIGKPSPIIVSELGRHILFLEDMRGGETLSWTDAQPLIRILLERREREKRIQTWLERSLQRSRVTWHDGDPYPVDEILNAVPVLKDRGRKLR